MKIREEDLEIIMEIAEEYDIPLTNSDAQRIYNQKVEEEGEEYEFPVDHQAMVDIIRSYANA